MILLVSSYGLQVSAANAHSASNHTCASLVLYHLSVSALNEERSVDLIDGFTSFLQMLRGKRIKDPTSWDRWSQKEIRTSSIWPEIRGLKSKQFPNWKFMNGLPMVLIPDTAHKKPPRNHWCGCSIPASTEKRVNSSWNIVWEFWDARPGGVLKSWGIPRSPEVSILK